MTDASPEVAPIETLKQAEAPTETAVQVKDIPTETPAEPVVTATEILEAETVTEAAKAAESIVEAVKVSATDTEETAPAEIPGIITTNFSDPTIKAFAVELYSGKKNHTDRIAILSDNVVAARVHYKDRYFLCQSEWKIAGKQEIATTEAACCVALGEPRKRFIVPILKYATQADGQPLKDIGAFQLMAWVFTQDKYILLRNLNNDFPLSDFDILVGCSEEKYQKLSIQVLPKKPMRGHEKWPKEYAEAAATFVASAKKRFPPLLGRSFTKQELMIHLGLAVAGDIAVATEAPMADVDDILKSL